MSTITAVLEPGPDGSVHLLLPPELQHSKVKVTAIIEPVVPAPTPKFGLLAGKIELAPDFDAPLDDFKEYTQ